MKESILTVLMTVYNAEQYVAEALESILNQTYKNFEFLIINDGSTDKTSEILKIFAAKDKRIKLIGQKNKGLVASLNRGMKEAKGKYIARQDADDRSEPERLQKQIDFLITHTKTVIVGSCIKVMDSQSKIIHRHAVLINDPELRQELLIRSPFAHGSVIFERQAAIDAGLYNSSAWPVEDYDLWLRLSAHGSLANLDEYLYVYREHNEGISQKNVELQHQKLSEVQAKAWRGHSRLLLKAKIDLKSYRNLDMGQERIERIINNNVRVSKLAWQHDQKSLAIKNMALLAGDKITYKKVAGKLRRKIKHENS